MVNKVLLGIFCCCMPYLLMAQSVKLEEYLEKGKELLEAEKYEEANLTFRRILTLNEVIPSEFCYYFATTLYHVHQYKNSENFIHKYYELTQDGGEFYQEVKALEALVDKELKEIISCELCDENGYEQTTCEVCDGSGTLSEMCHLCRGSGKVSCSICKGEGVLITDNYFGRKEYKTCHQCKGLGYETCQVCQGTKTIPATCNTCDGDGLRSTNQICNHTQETNDLSINKKDAPTLSQ